jgi:DNA-binding XRE family transcriptional regulator
MPIDGRKVEYYRVRQGKTRRELADVSGYSYSLICVIENEDTGGSVKSAEAIAAVLALTIEDIWIYRKDEREHRRRRTRW